MTTKKKAPAKVKPVKRGFLLGNQGFISVGKRTFAVCDKKDFHRLSSLRWHLHKGKAGRLYARCTVSYSPRRRVFMHALLMGPGADHINGDGLDNRRRNLRQCTTQENGWNRTSNRGTSQYKGVHWDRRKRLWCSSITKNGKQHHLAYCEKESDAAIFYDVAAQILFGAFARTNGLSPRVLITPVE